MPGWIAEALIIVGPFAVAIAGYHATKNHNAGGKHDR